MGEAAKEQETDKSPFLTRITSHNDKGPVWAYVAIKAELFDAFDRARRQTPPNLKFESAEDDRVIVTDGEIELGRVIQNKDGSNLIQQGEEPPEDIIDRVRTLFDEGRYRRVPKL